jgi:hypothetical protein
MLQDATCVTPRLSRMSGVWSAHADGSARSPRLYEMLRNLAFSLGAELAPDNDARWHAWIVRGAADSGAVARFRRMKDQYVGDVNDFYKYALLREMAGADDGRLVVAWMRTAPDATRDGRDLGYLASPERFRAVDPELFDRLSQVVVAGNRSLAAVEQRGILPAAAFYSELVSDDAAGRAEWFRRLRAILRPGDLVFFDPDNGLEVRSVRPGRQNASKYLHWLELSEALERKRSLCVYQHFARRPRVVHLEELAGGIRGLKPSVAVAFVVTPRVAFLLAGEAHPVENLCRAAQRVIARSPGTMSLLRL